MTFEARRNVFFLGIAGLLAVLVWGALGLPAYGDYRGPYGDVAARVAVEERHATDVVSAVNFDVRAIDTLGEEFILFTSVMGVVLLLRKRVAPKETEQAQKEEAEADVARGRAIEPPSNAVRLLCLSLVGVSIVFGLYVITHGQLTPGGGFQGGVILATVPLLVYLSGDVRVLNRIAPRELVDAGEALAAGALIGVGLVAIALGEPFLTNVLPLGTTGQVDSSGTIVVLSVFTGIEVSAGFVVLLSSFLAETLERTSESASESSQA